MDHFAGLDVSVKETSVCIVDDTGRIVREVKVASEPEALLTALKSLPGCFGPVAGHPHREPYSATRPGGPALLDKEALGQRQ